jgi:hypothetical protein
MFDFAALYWNAIGQFDDHFGRPIAITVLLVKETTTPLIVVNHAGQHVWCELIGRIMIAPDPETIGGQRCGIRQNLDRAPFVWSVAEYSIERSLKPKRVVVPRFR